MKKQPRWALPNPKDAQVRATKEVVIEKSLFQIPKRIRLSGQEKKYYLRTYGCQANERDSETPAGTLEEMNSTAAEYPGDADLILTNTCTIRKNAKDKVLEEIGSPKRLKRKRSDLLFGLCGCTTQEEDVIAKLLEMYRHVNLTFGTHNVYRLPELLYDVMVNGNRSVEVLSKKGDVIESLPVRHFGKHKTWVNIMYGYNKFYTYYTVPCTRGEEHSRMMEDILEKVRIPKAEGFKEITLPGQNVSPYGKDLHMESGFVGLLEETAKIGIERTRFTMSHPWNFTNEMIDVIVRYGNIMLSIHLPVQSGDSNIPKTIGRRYIREQYLAPFRKIRERIPHRTISADIVVGFPNETEEWFQNALPLVGECRSNNTFTFIYSPREGTPAAFMVDNVELAVKQRHLQKLSERWNLYAREKNEEHLGSVIKILVDDASKKNPEISSGCTEISKLVDFRRTTAQSGDIVSVRITACKISSPNREQT